MKSQRAKEARLDAIVNHHKKMFAAGQVEVCLEQIPFGWLPILGWALKELEKAGKEVCICRIERQDGSLAVAFNPGGNEVGERMFQKLLDECREYCPTCGKPWD